MAMALARAPEPGPCMELRPYQLRLVNEAVGKNVVVVLPTGSGKTLIAAELVARNPGRALVLVPTVLLVEQQAHAVREWLHVAQDQRTRLRTVAEYSGGKTLASAFDVLVTTPKAFEIAQAKQEPGGSLQWQHLGLLVFDEVHHVLKDHPYRKLALALKRHTDRETGLTSPAVVGLTASLTYAVTDQSIKASITKLCSELQLTEVLTANDDELLRGGYNGTRAAATVRTVTQTTDNGLIPPKERKPHLMQQMFDQRIASREATPFALSIVAVVTSLESAIAELDPSFRPPRLRSSVSKWEQMVHKMSAKGVVAVALNQLCMWYGVLKVLVVSWEEADYIACTLVNMYGLDITPPELSTRFPQLAAKTRHFIAELPTSFARLDILSGELLRVYAESENEFRGVVFAEQRITTHALEYFISNNPSLKELFRPTVIYASSAAASPTLSVSASAQKNALSQFKSGICNLLICTTAAEEGMDVPAANCVIRFDSMQHSVSLAQGRGRARQANSQHVALSERSDRTVAQLETAEAVQREACAAFVHNVSPEAKAKALEMERTAQTSRERNAIEKLEHRIATGCNGIVDDRNAMGLLNQICKATKVDLVEVPGKDQFMFKYDSILRQLEGRGQGSKKKTAKRKAAVDLLEHIRAGMRQKQ